jgi:hypothetical protein
MQTTHRPGGPRSNWAVSGRAELRNLLVTGMQPNDWARMREMEEISAISQGYLKKC